jgi:hypothetical protein
VQPVQALAAVALILVVACAGSAAPTTSQPPAPPLRPEHVRYLATVPPLVSEHGDVSSAALLGAGRFLAQQLAAGGGAAREVVGPALQRPAYVFHVTVGTVEAADSGRTRASVTAIVRTEEGGRVVGILRGTATAFVERTQPLAVRQQRAIEGAIEGALQRLSELLDRLERDTPPVALR